MTSVPGQAARVGTSRCNCCTFLILGSSAFHSSFPVLQTAVAPCRYKSCTYTNRGGRHMNASLARHRILIALFFCSTCCLLERRQARADDIAQSAGHSAAGWAVLADSENGFAFTLLHGNAAVGHIGVAGWGPNWAWAGI